MGRHTLDTELDTPAADFFLDRHDRPTMSVEVYREGYDRRRVHAEHVPARYASWRFTEPDGSTFWNYYRESAWDESLSCFYAALEREAHMISSSDGWVPNRAKFIYDEAWAEQAERERGLHVPELSAAQLVDNIVDTHIPMSNYRG